MECGIRHSVLLLTGSNFRGKEQILQRAAERIAEQVGPIERASQICYSEAWGFTCEEEFANQAILVSTGLAADEVLMKTQAIEQELGRDREALYYFLIFCKKLHDKEEIDQAFRDCLALIISRSCFGDDDAEL